MITYTTETSNYNKQPVVPVDGHEHDCWCGWDNIILQLKNQCLLLNKTRIIITIECYTGVDEDCLLAALSAGLSPDNVYLTGDVMKLPEEIDRMIYPDVTDDEVFGYLTRLHMDDFFDQQKLQEARRAMQSIEKGVVLVLGAGASLLTRGDIYVYADMPRWEGQLRFRRNEVSNLGTQNKTLKASLQYKRAYFVDWRVCDRLKRELMEQWDYVLDTVNPDEPKIATGLAVRDGLRQTVDRPFRVVPFFDPGPWGGQWMKEVCDLDRSANNYAWCFDCVPEENSLLLGFGDVQFEVPSVNLVFYEPQKLLGGAVYARFGLEFPIRFDFLDTIEGGNLSLQVHPLTEYIQEHFGMPYTQDESYYILDARSDACVYLGLKETAQPDLMLKELRQAQLTAQFDVEKHVEKWPVKKHDHILIPAGTVHCSGKNAMVLEISATPYIFTFKLWDWGRLGLDGMPRPINIQHGTKVIQWDRTTEWVANNLINQVEKVTEGDGWIEERTGLHKTEFIETRRHWFTKQVDHHTHGNLNVLNLIQGREAIVESPTGAFAPFIVHYAETFIVPAGIGAYTIRPFGEGIDQQCATIKAFVRTKTNFN